MDFMALSPAQIAALDQACDAFEATWRAGDRPGVEAYVALAAESLRPILRRELLALEAELLRDEGRRVRPTAPIERTAGAVPPSEKTLPPPTPTVTLPIRESFGNPEKGDRGLEAGTRIGPYTLLRVLGRGGFGVVWLAERAGAIATTWAALKMPLEGSADLDQIRREAALWVRAGGHPNVLPIIEADIYDGRIVIASEFAPDGSLARWLEGPPGERPSLEEAAELLLEILDGLEHLHVRKIIHRDLKPANILLQGRTPRIADFGLARVLGISPHSGAVAGTPAYMAPEAIGGERSEQSDLWSVGVIGYQMLTGRLPFRGSDIFGLMRAIADARPGPLPSSVPPPLGKVIQQALEKEPGRRHRTAADMRAALRDALKQRAAGRTPIQSEVRKNYRAIAVTGTTGIDVERATSRLIELATPYLGCYTTWYCGTFGAVDEAAASYLRQQDQRVIAVGYDAWDLSSRMRELVEGLAIPVVDAENEPVPDEPGAPSSRDIYFATKADLLMILWDGRSTGTGQLLEWLRRQGKDHLVGFVSQPDGPITPDIRLGKSNILE